MLSAQRLILLLMALVMTFALGACGNVTVLHYTIPDTYQGFLVIRYACPQGEPVVRQDGRIHITFQDNGTACLAAGYTDIFPSGVFHVARVETLSGQSIRFAGSVDKQSSGYALVDLSVMQDIKGPSPDAPTDTYGILWVGDVADLSARAQAGEYSNQLADFLEQHVGVPRNPAQQSSKARPRP